MEAMDLACDWTISTSLSRPGPPVKGEHPHRSREPVAPGNRRFGWDAPVRLLRGRSSG